MTITGRLSVVAWILLAIAIGDWLALRRGLATHPPALLALLVAIVAVLLGIRATGLLIRLVKSHRVLTTSAELAVVGGILVALVAGSANWLLRLQGTVILNELEAVPLHGGTALQVFDAGVFARIEEMELMLVLDELELRPAGGDGFIPVSHLRVWRGEREPRDLEVSPRQRAEFGRIRLHQGAFGFAPRIVILRDGQTVFDRVVPFLTERFSHQGISFEGKFSVEAEKLDVGATVDLDSLDEGMRGHASLAMQVTREKQVLGQGSLLPGHFADLEGGYRVGFADLQQWSEIVISRRNYGQFVKAGGIVAVIGLVVWPLAAWRRW